MNTRVEAGAKRNYVRKSQATLSSDEVPVAGNGRSIPIDALHVPQPEPEIDVMDARMSAVDEEAFMNETLVIMVPRSSVEGDLAYVEVGCNGEKVQFPRGRSVRLKRKFVSVLLDAKHSQYSQRVDQSDPMNIQTPLDEAISLYYDVNLLQDTQRGMDWARGRMHLAA
jgi:hypothetical protein